MKPLTEIDGRALRRELIRAGIIRPVQGSASTPPTTCEPGALALDDEARKTAARTIRDPKRHGVEPWSVPPPRRGESKGQQ